MSRKGTSWDNTASEIFFAWIVAGLCLLPACRATGDSDSSVSGASDTGDPSESAGTRPTTGTSTEGNITSADGQTDDSSGAETTGAPATACGGTCFSEAVAEAYSICRSNLDGWPCAVSSPCPAASVRCDVDGENCVFEWGDADAYVEAVACVFDGVLSASPGLYAVWYSQESDDPERLFGDFWGVRPHIDVDGSAQLLTVVEDPFGGTQAVYLDEVDLSCVQAQMAGVSVPTSFEEVVPVMMALSDALEDTCNERCLTVFETFVTFPDDLPCE